MVPAEPRGLDRLRHLSRTNPARAQRIADQGDKIARVTNAGVHLGAAIGFGLVGCHGGGYWSPYWNHGWGNWGPWYGWCGPKSWWWWACTSYWSPWSPGCGFSYWYHNYGFYWGSPFSHYGGYAYCAPAPIYYSSAIYDHYEPASQVVIYAQPAPVAEGLPVAAGEGTIDVPSNLSMPSSEGSTAQSDALGRAAGHYLTLGDRAFREGRYSDAVHFYAKAVEFSPNDGVLYLILSDALFATGDYHYAAYALRRALELDASVIDSIVDKHGFYADPGEFDRQLALLERYVQDHFLDNDARFVLAANYLFAQRAEQALDVLESAFSLEVRESPAGKALLARAREGTSSSRESTHEVK